MESQTPIQPQITLEQIRHVIQEEVAHFASKDELRQLETRLKQELEKRPTKTGVHEIVDSKLTALTQKLENIEKVINTVNLAVEHMTGTVDKFETMLRDISVTQKQNSRLLGKHDDTLKLQGGALVTLRADIYGDPNHRTGNVPVFEQVGELRKSLDAIPIQFQIALDSAVRDLKGMMGNLSANVSSRLNRLINEAANRETRLMAMEAQMGYYRKLAKRGLEWISEMLSHRKGVIAGGLGALIPIIIDWLSKGGG